MARVHGTAGKSLRTKLLVLLLLAGGVGLVTYLVVLLISPALAPFAPLLALVAFLTSVRGF